MRPQVRSPRKTGRHAKHSEDRMPVRRMSARELVAEAEEILAKQARIDNPDMGLWQHTRPADGEFVCWVYDVRKHGAHVANLLHP
jgi:hypothetical protein